MPSVMKTRPKALHRSRHVPEVFSFLPARHHRGILTKAQMKIATAMPAKMYIIQEYWMFQKISRPGSVMSTRL